MLCYFPGFRFPAVVCLLLWAGTLSHPQAAAPVTPANATLTSVQPSLTSSQIVDEMLRHNQARAQELKHYESERNYAVEYRGYKAHIAATLVVDATYDSSTGKTFRVVSQSGNGLLVDKVLKRLVASEQDADHDKSSTALTPANYRFTLVGVDTLDGRPAYVLEVEPLVESKYLYRGKIWVDASEFAVAKIAASPAKTRRCGFLRRPSTTNTPGWMAFGSRPRTGARPRYAWGAPPF